MIGGIKGGRHDHNRCLGGAVALRLAAASQAMNSEFAEFHARMQARADVLGIVLSGSQARKGMATELSDHDVFLIVEAGSAVVEAPKGTDVAVMSLPEFRDHALPGSGTEWNRYAFAHTEILKDTSDGLIAELSRAKATLTAQEAARITPQALDAFLNSAYRAAKNDRDGDALAARLDASEALPYCLEYLFALHRRVRPYNKYLAWELRNHPLDEPVWSHENLLPLLEQALSAEPMRGVRRLFAELEPRARAAGHGPVLDGWGGELALLRAR